MTEQSPELQFLTQVITEAISNRFDIDPVEDRNFASIPTHSKVVFTQGTNVFVISMSMATVQNSDTDTMVRKLRDPRTRTIR